MKKQSLQLLVVALLLSTAAVQAQTDFRTGSGEHFIGRYTTNTDAYSASLGWKHLQLGQNGPNYIIGGRTQRGGSLVFVTDNTATVRNYPGGVNSTNHNGNEAMTLSAEGNVGIGTTAPQRPLDVIGQIRASEDSNEGGSIVLRNLRKTGAAAPVWALYNMTGPYGDSFQLYNYPASGGNIPRFRINDDGTTVLAPSGGAVGVNTATPLDTLDVNGGISGHAIELADPTPYIDFHYGGNRGVDFDVRLINNSPGLLTAQANFAVTGQLSCQTLALQSDEDAKTGFRKLDFAKVLAKIPRIEISEWEYKDVPGVRHYGAMAQQFHVEFGLGPDDKHINPLDVGSLALVGVQALKEKVESKDAEIAELKALNASLQRQVAEVMKQVTGIQDVVAALAKAMPRNGTQKASFRPEATR